MHELGITLEIFELVEEIMEEQDLKKVSSVTIEAGELCGILPDYLLECWKAVAMGSAFEDTQLILQVIPATAKCSCGTVYEMMKNSRICPNCGKTDYKIVGGKEFNIKQIEAY